MINSFSNIYTEQGNKTSKMEIPRHFGWEPFLLHGDPKVPDTKYGVYLEVYQNISSLWKKKKKSPNFGMCNTGTLLCLLISTKKVMYKIGLHLKLKVQRNFK